MGHLNKWVTSDTHFFHKNILKYQPDDRPFGDVQVMNEELIIRWNSCVAPNDLIYHCGDFAFAPPHKIIKLLKLLNGRKILIRGNHDHHMNRPEIAEHFEAIHDYLEIHINRTLVVLCHYPIFSWNRMHHGAVHLYGHTHGSIPTMTCGISKDIGMDTNKCYPYNLYDLVAKMKVDQSHKILDPRESYESRNQR